MKLIWNSGEEKQPNGPSTKSQDALPAGEYQGEILKSEARQSKFVDRQTAANPEAWELYLEIEVHHDGKRFRVFDSIPITHVNRISQALASAGLPVLAAGMQSFEEERLQGQTVTIRTFVSKAGNARIGDYIAPKAVIQGKKAGPSRGKVDASDIPF